MKKIYTTKGMYVIVDDEDYEWLNQYNWCYNSGYAGRRENKKIILMHRQIMGFPKGMLVDHKNGNIQDNRRSNLRICTKAENQRNHKRSKKNTSGYNGVTFRKDTKKWFARIGDTQSGTFHHLGCFHSPVEAAKAYDKAAKKYFGEFARLNFPEDAE